jgi:hypothetical protein
MKDLRSRHLVLLLGLLSVLASAPLRLAEAASDQARTVAELDGDVSIEPVDGGIGDEPEEATLSEAFSFLSYLDFSSDFWNGSLGLDPASVHFRTSSEPMRRIDGPVISLLQRQCRHQPLLI